MVWEVETNRLVPLYTPLFFGWTISLSSELLSLPIKDSGAIIVLTQLEDNLLLLSLLACHVKP
jgi:hypothetical protein